MNRRLIFINLLYNHIIQLNHLKIQADIPISSNLTLNKLPFLSIDQNKHILEGVSKIVNLKLFPFEFANKL